jgi:hypothetical protein
VLLVFGAQGQLPSLAGLEHGRIIPLPAIGQIEIPHRNSLGIRRPNEIVLVNAMPDGNPLQLVSHDQNPLEARTPQCQTDSQSNLAPSSQIIGAK